MPKIGGWWVATIVALLVLLVLGTWFYLRMSSPLSAPGRQGALSIRLADQPGSDSAHAWQREYSACRRV